MSRSGPFVRSAGAPVNSGSRQYNSNQRNDLSYSGPKMGDRSWGVGNDTQPDYNYKAGQSYPRYSELDQRKDLYGIGSNLPPQDPAQFSDSQNRDYYDAFLDTIDGNTEIMITNITEADQFPFDFMPWRLARDKLQFKWSVWKFNDSYMVRTPEEAVARYASNRKMYFEEGLFRFGHGIKMERGHFYTADGQKEYRYKLQQIWNAVVEGQCYDILLAMLESEYSEHPNWRALWNPNQINQNVGLHQKFNMELNNWACINKGPINGSGLQTLHARMNKVYQRQTGEFFDILVHAQGVGDFWQGLANTESYASTGLSTDKLRGREKYLNGARYYESRNFRMGNHRPDEDPFIRTRTIGTYFRMNDEHIRDIPYGEFKTSMLDTRIYNETTDDWYDWRYRDHFGDLCLYHDWDNEMSISAGSRHPSLSRFGEVHFGEHVQSYLAAYESLGGSYVEDLVDAIASKEKALRDLVIISSIPFQPASGELDQLRYKSASLDAHLEHAGGRSMASEGFIEQRRRAIQKHSNARRADVDESTGEYETRYNKNYGRRMRGSGDGDDDDMDDYNPPPVPRRRGRARAPIRRAPATDSTSEDDDSSSSSSGSDSGSDSDDDNSNLDDIRKSIMGADGDGEDDDLDPLVDLLESTTDGEHNYVDELKRLLHNNRKNKSWKSSPRTPSWKSMSSYLLEDELEATLNEVNRNKRNTPLTALENAALKTRSTSFTSSDHDVTAALTKANAHSYQWLVENDTENNRDNPAPIQVFSDPSFTVTTDLPFNACATTLTSRRVVLFSMTDKACETLKDGKIQLDISHIPQPMTEPSYAKGAYRLAALQYSVTLSAIGYYIQQMRQEVFDQDTDGAMTEEDIKAIQLNYLTKITALASVGPIRGTRAQFADFMNNALPRLKVCTFQGALAPYIQTLKFILRAIMAGDVDSDKLLHLIHSAMNFSPSSKRMGNSGDDEVYEAALARVQEDAETLRLNLQQANEEEPSHELAAQINRISSRGALGGMFAQWNRNLYNQMRKVNKHYNETFNEVMRLAGLLFRSGPNQVVDSYDNGVELVNSLIQVINRNKDYLAGNRDAEITAWIHSIMDNHNMRPESNQLYAHVKQAVAIKTKTAERGRQAFLHAFNVPSRSRQGSRGSKKNNNNKKSAFYFQYGDDNELRTIKTILRHQDLDGPGGRQVHILPFVGPLEDQPWATAIGILKYASLAGQTVKHVFRSYENALKGSANQTVSDIIADYIAVEEADPNAVAAFGDITGSDFQDNLSREEEEGESDIERKANEGLSPGEDNGMDDDDDTDSVNSAEVDLDHLKINNLSLGGKKKLIRDYLSVLPLHDGRLMNLLLKHDIKPPVGYVNYSPHMQYKTGACLAARRGKIGASIFHSPDMIVGEDADNLTISGTFVMYSKAIVFFRQWLLRVFDVYCSEYMSGNGVEAIKYLNTQDRKLYTQKHFVGDIFCTPRPINFPTVSQPLDITGQYQSALGPTAEEKYLCSYPTSSLMVKELAWQHSSHQVWDLSWESSIQKEMTAEINTICFQRHQFLYKHSDKELTRVVLENGHWGPEIGPGCGKIRNGFVAMPKTFNWANENVTRVVR